jgi:hypothetical protein
MDFDGVTNLVSQTSTCYRGDTGTSGARTPYGLHDALCSGLMIPDTQIGGTLATQEVFNEKTTSFLYP